MAGSDPLAGLGRIAQALRLLDDIDAHHDKDAPERARTAALRPRLHRLALKTLEADLDTLEGELND